MLIKFSCQNFRSIGMQPLELSMVAAPKIKMHLGHISSPLDTVKLLRNAAVYGANAAGKSNVVRALDFMKASVVNGSLPQDTTREYCRVGEGLSKEMTTFEMQFEIDGQAYDYGLSCALIDYRVISEWLYELGDSEKMLFERANGAEITFSDELLGAVSKNDRMRAHIYKEDFVNQVKTAPPLLFLSAVGRDKRFDESSPLSAFSRSYRWFARNLHVMVANQPSPTSDFYVGDKTLNEVAEVLASFDTGISNLSKREISMEELERQFSFPLAMSIRQLLSQPQLGGDLVLTVRDGAAFVGVERHGSEEPTVTILEIRHQGSSSSFAFGDESDGTRRLFDFMDLLFSKQKDAVFIVDEIDRSLHPMLTQQLVDLFNEIHKEDACQLLFTTHENAIMSYDYLRKDEIWFVDRDAEGYSHLYPLDDFESVRTDSRLSKQYLEGRYGGIPALSMARALAALQEGEE